MADRPTFNWMVEPESPRELFAKLITNLGYSFSTGSSRRVATNILSIDTGYRLVFSEGFGENQIHPVTLEGAGEVLPEHGYSPILFFAALQKKMKEELPLHACKFTFCTEVGEPVRLDDWPKLKAELSRLGIFESDAFDCIRAKAEAVGFVDPIFRLDKLGDDEPSNFF